MFHRFVSSTWSERLSLVGRSVCTVSGMKDNVQKRASVNYKKTTVGTCLLVGPKVDISACIHLYVFVCMSFEYIAYCMCSRRTLCWTAAPMQWWNRLCESKRWDWLWSDKQKRNQMYRHADYTRIWKSHSRVNHIADWSFGCLLLNISNSAGNWNL